MLTIRKAQIEAMAQHSARGQPVRYCPGHKTWIEVVLIGEDARPVPDARYRLTLPDGAVVEGRLDARGLARVEGIDPGACRLEFPDLDEESVSREE